MGFKITDLKKPSNSTLKLTESYKHECGVSIDLVVENTPAFANAFGTVIKTMNRVASIANLSKNNQSDLTSDDSMIFMIGEYCISDWNFEDEKGDKIPIDGESFLTVLASLIDQDEKIGVEIATAVMQKFSDMTVKLKEQAEEKQRQVAKTVKKPSKSGSTKAK